MDADPARATAPTVAVIGPLPPPLHGHMVFTRRLLGSRLLGSQFRLIHVDISDHRGFETLGRFDPTNVLLALRHYLRLVVVLARDRPDVVHVPLSQNMLGLGRDLGFVALVRIGRSSVVAQVHGGGLDSLLATSPRWFATPARWLLRRCAALVVMTRSRGEALAAAVPGVRIVVVPHGTETTNVAPRTPDGSPLRALYVSSHLSEQKGLRPLVQSAVRAQESGITAEWEIVGAWLSEDARARAEARVRAVPGIHIRGALDRERVAEAYSRADVFVFPTGASEGFALVRIEAMAAGLPVITTEAGGGGEIVREGLEGFIVDYDAPEEIVARLRALRDDPGLLAEMSRRAQTRQRASFSEPKFESGLAHLWHQVTAVPTAPRTRGSVRRLRDDQSPYGS